MSRKVRPSSSRFSPTHAARMPLTTAHNTAPRKRSLLLLALCSRRTMEAFLQALFAGQKDDPDNLAEENALHIFKAARAGDIPARFELGCLSFDNGLFARAYEEFTAVAADESDSLLRLNATFHLGVMAYDCLVEGDEAANLAMGLECMRTIAATPASSVRPSKNQSRHLRTFEDIVQSAQYNLGNAFFQGYGVPANYEEAVKFWKLAAKEGAPSGNHQAQFALGQYYGSAHILPNDPLRSTTPDLTEALSWHKQAAKNGNPDSMCALGKMFITGSGVKKDVNEGKKFLKEASDLGHEEATAELVPVYFHLKMHGKAVQSAEPLLRNAASLTDSDLTALLPHQREYLSAAVWYYGRCVEKGLGGQSASLSEARKHYSLAAKLDSRTAAQLVQRAAHGQV